MPVPMTFEGRSDATRQTTCCIQGKETQSEFTPVLPLLLDQAPHLRAVLFGLAGMPLALLSMVAL